VPVCLPVQGASLSRRTPSAAVCLPLSRNASLPYQPQMGSGGSGGHCEGLPPGLQRSQGLRPVAPLPRSSSDCARGSRGEAKLLISPDQRRSSASDADGGFPALGVTPGSRGRSPPGLHSFEGKLKRSSSEGGAALLAADSEQQLEVEQEHEPPLAPAPTEKLDKDDVLR
jgi:hypothetical protein